MTVVDLDSPDLSWNSYAIAGSEVPADLVMLHADQGRQTRTVVVAFPDGWRRDAIGHQPAGEEMVLLSGGLAISGLTVEPGQLLVAHPLATRAATSVADGTRALVWFSGPGGGWADGPAETPGEVRVLPLATGVVRAETTGLPGSVEVRTDVAGAVFEADADLFWPGSRQYAHVPAGEPAPDVAGEAVVRLWA